MSRKRIFRLSVITLVVTALCLFLLKLSSEIKIDSCFDAGGVWDKENQECVGAKEYYYN